MRAGLCTAASATLLVVACGEVSAPSPGDGDGGDPDMNPCPRASPAADRTRKVVISHPFDAGGGASSLYEVLELTAAGVLGTTGLTFSLSRAFDAEIVFTPDGEVGIVAHDDGTLGVFRFNEAGSPEVVHTFFTGDFYAESVVMHPAGDRAYIIDEQWQAHGGGIHTVRIGCDGSLTYEGLLVPTHLGGGMALTTSGRRVVAAHAMLDAPVGDDVHLASASSPVARVASADLFRDDEQSVTAIALTADERYFLVADGALFAAAHRIGAVEVLTSTLMPVQELALAQRDPTAIVVSPFNNAFLLLTAGSGVDDAFTVWSYDSTDALAPFAYAGEVAYHGARPALPAVAAVITRGGLTGRVLVAENLGLRQVQFLADGEVADLGKWPSGAGPAAIVGALGVQP